MFSADVRSGLECVRPVDHDIITMNQQLNIDTLETPTQQQLTRETKKSIQVCFSLMNTLSCLCLCKNKKNLQSYSHSQCALQANSSSAVQAFEIHINDNILLKMFSTDFIQRNLFESIQEVLASNRLASS